MSGLTRIKYMTFEQGGFVAFLILLALVCLVIAGKSFDQVMAFHTTLGAIFAAAGVFYIFRDYLGRGETPIPAEIDGKPNYNMGPVKFAAVISMFWGIAGFLVGVIIASQLAWPALNFDLPWTSFGRLRPLHTSAVIFAFGGNVLNCYFILCCSAYL